MKKVTITESDLVEMIKKIVETKLSEIDKEEIKEKKKKKDRCHRCADQSYGPETSAYKSGAMVKCRQGKIWKGKQC